MSHEDFDLESLAAYLHLLPQKVGRLADRGKLPGRKVGGEWRFSRAEIHHWLENRIGLADEEELVSVEGALRRGRGPEEPPIVSVGDRVSSGQVIGTIEALRKLTDVVAPVAGVVDEVLVDDGESVQFGDKLFAIRREG